MDLKIIAIYYICDEVISALHIQEDPQSKMSTAEVMTVGIVSALFYGANIELTRRFLKLCGYIPKILSHSRLHRRLLSISRENWETVFTIIKSTLMQVFPSNEFAVDSCPLLACQPCRSWRCQLYQGKEYLGYCASKKLYFYGLKLHLIVSENGIIIEFCLFPASKADITALKEMLIDLPKGAILYGDRAYNSTSFEKELKEMADILLIPQRKRKNKNQHPGHIQYLQKTRRRVVETVLSQITRLMPRSIKAKSAYGFELRILLFILAYMINFTTKTLTC